MNKTLYCVLFFLSVLATQALADSHQSNSEHSCIRFRNKSSSNSLQSVPSFHKSAISPLGLFKVHFDTIGFYAVSRIDLNNNDVPDYIDSVCHYLDYAYEVEINQMKFKAPPKTGDYYNIYVTEIGNEQTSYLFEGTSLIGYGFTFQDATLTKSCGTVATAYVVLDNNYSPADSFKFSSRNRQTYNETGITALKATCAHEFHHMVQLGYSIQLEIQFAEATSTYLEHRVHPDSYDFLQYTRAWYRNVQEYSLSCSSGSCQQSGYAYSLFLHFLHEKHSDSVLRKLWEYIGTCNPARNEFYKGFEALDKSLSDIGASLESDYCEFTTWMYNTGHRKKETRPSFSFVDSLPLVSFDNMLNSNAYVVFSEPSLMEANSVYPFQTKFLRYLLPNGSTSTSDTLDIGITNSNTKAAIRGDQRSLEFSLTLVNKPTDGFTRLEQSNYYYKIRVDSSFVCHTIFFNGGFTTKQLPDPTPNPFKLSVHSSLDLPAPDFIPNDARVRVLVYAPDGSFSHYADTQKVTTTNSVRSIRIWDTPPSSPQLSSGVYFYTIEWNSQQEFGKFVVTQ